MSVSVSASRAISEAMIEEFLRSKASFILRALDRYEEAARNAPPPKEYIDGEVYRVFGLDMTLQVTRGKRNRVSCDEQRIFLEVTNTSDKELKKRTFDAWLRTVCDETIRPICERVFPLFSEYGIAFPELRFRSMRSRWGSCQPTHSVVTFSTKLVEVPLPAVEYVVIHEFVHFIHPDHSARFYNQVASFMPDWKERKAMLEEKNTSNIG